MNDQTIRILSRDLELISDYRQAKLPLRGLVDSLEGSINALEERLPRQFYGDWEKSWGELEIALALDKEELYASKIGEELANLERLIIELLPDQGNKGDG